MINQWTDIDKMNHLGDTNKMVSNTPRTDELLTAMLDVYGYVHNGNCPQRWVNHARELERELNAANERIERLEAVVNDPHALWTNWLRGDVKLPAGIGDVRQYQDRIKRLEEAGDALANHHLLVVTTYDKAKTHVSDWNKAKEDKP